MSKIASIKDLVSYLAILHRYLNSIEYIIASEPIIILNFPISKIASVKDLVSYLGILHGYLNSSIEYILASKPFFFAVKNIVVTGKVVVPTGWVKNAVPGLFVLANGKNWRDSCVLG